MALGHPTGGGDDRMPRGWVLVQMIALARMPLDLVCETGAEKVLKNAKHARAAEVLEVATRMGARARRSRRACAGTPLCCWCAR
jgi:hypothetical protein